jgi:hypothetical protein
MGESTGANSQGINGHGQMGTSDDMKTRKTNLETVEPDLDKAAFENSAVKRPQKPEVRLGREAQVRIGETLRSMYNSYVHQGVPDHLADLVRRLGEQE